MNNIKLDSNKNDRTRKLPFAMNLPIVVIPKEPLLGKQVFRDVSKFIAKTYLNTTPKIIFHQKKAQVDCRCNYCIPTDEMPIVLLLLASAAALVRN